MPFHSMSSKSRPTSRSISATSSAHTVDSDSTRKTLSAASVSAGATPTRKSLKAVDSKDDSDEPLPEGWERRISPENLVYYTDHNTKTTSWKRPTQRSSETNVNKATIPSDLADKDSPKEVESKGVPSNDIDGTLASVPSIDKEDQGWAKTTSTQVDILAADDAIQTTGSDIQESTQGDRVEVLPKKEHSSTMPIVPLEAQTPSKSAQPLAQAIPSASVPIISEPQLEPQPVQEMEPSPTAPSKPSKQPSSTIPIDTQASQSEIVFDSKILMSSVPSSSLETYGWFLRVTDSVKLTEHSTKGADTWFYDHLKRCDKFLGMFREKDTSPSETVKIAILDTGADLKHPLLQPFSRDGRFGEQWDFIEDRVQITDYTGHGTHCAHLILQTAPRAKVCIARVFESCDSDAKTAPAIVKVSNAFFIRLFGPTNPSRPSIELSMTGRPMSCLSPSPFPISSSRSRQQSDTPLAKASSYSPRHQTTVAVSSERSDSRQA